MLTDDNEKLEVVIIMKFFKDFFSKKYLNWIYSILLLAMCLYMIIFSSAGYVLMRKTVLNNELNTNNRLLQQLKYNVNSMNEMLVYLSYSLYFDADYQHLMYNKMLDEVNTTMKIGALNNSYMKVYPFIDSIYFYNYETKKFYSANNKAAQDSGIVELFDSGDQLPILKPIYRTLPSNPINPDVKKEVFTYLMYEYKDSNKKPMGAVIINKNVNWLIDNIRTLNNDNQASHEMIFIMDENGQLFGGSPSLISTSILSENIRDSLKKDMPDLSAFKGSFDIKIGNKDYLVNYLMVEKADWTLLKIQPYENIYQSVDTLRKIFSILTFIFVLAALFVARKLSYSIYKPIQNLMGQVTATDSDSNSQAGRVDEIKYLSEVYNKSVDQLNTFKIKINSDRQIIRNAFLRRLISDSLSISKPDYDNAKLQFGLTIEGTFVVCVLQIDDLYQFEKQYHCKDRELYKFAIMNIAGELIGKTYSNEMFDVNNDTMVSIVNVTGQVDQYESVLESVLRKAQEYIMFHFRLSFSVSISELTAQYSQLTPMFQQALINSKYRICLGKKCIITLNRLKDNNQNTQDSYSVSLQKKFIQEIKSGNLKAAEDNLSKMIQEISKLSYNNIILAMINVIHDIKSAVTDMNLTKTESICLDFRSLEGKVFEFETLDEFSIQIENTLQMIADKTVSPENEKYLMIVETVKDVIRNHYHDNRLCLQFIADKIFLDPKYVSKVFRNITQLSILEYINDFRLERAIQLLNASQMTVTEILVNVGFENESYFYKQFKKKFGLTPREYAIKLTREHVRVCKDED